MSKFIIGAFVVITAFFLLMFYIKGAIRRFLGITPQSKKPQSKEEVLYQQNGTTVLRGDADQEGKK